MEALKETSEENPFLLFSKKPPGAVTRREITCRRLIEGVLGGTEGKEGGNQVDQRRDHRGVEADRVS